eukprot:2395145-Prorocentrum_lima.AAC.1
MGGHQGGVGLMLRLGIPCQRLGKLDVVPSTYVARPGPWVVIFRRHYTILLGSLYLYPSGTE